MSNRKTLSDDFGYSSFRSSGSDADVIDASSASWIVANKGSQTNTYPFLVEQGQAGVDVIGGTVDGEVSQTLSWGEAYVNSAAVMLRDTEDATLRDWTISQPWDGLRVAGDSEGFEIANVHVTDARDDAVENDDAVSGTIRDSLFDGVFVGISLGDAGTPDRSDEVVTIDNVLMRMESYTYKGETTHGPPMKMQEESPQLRITDSVFAIEDVDHFGDWRQELAWEKTIESSGNTFLNLSDTPLPKDYAMPGEGWTVLQGQEARDYWQSARAEHLGEQDAGGSAAEPAPAGADAEFVLDVLPEAGSAPEFKDFDPATDQLRLDPSVFSTIDSGGGGATGLLAPAQFAVAARADDSDDHVMYKWKTGELFYDRDGAGGERQVKIAQLDERLDMDFDDVLVGDADTSGPATNTATLTGTSGDDVFEFDSSPGEVGIVEIADFDPGNDALSLDQSVFSTIDPGRMDDALAPAQFKVAGQAEDGDDHVMYKWNTGELFYDRDGAGGEDQVQIAQLDARMSLDHDDFVVA